MKYKLNKYVCIYIYIRIIHLIFLLFLQFPLFSPLFSAMANPICWHFSQLHRRIRSEKAIKKNAVNPIKKSTKNKKRNRKTKTRSLKNPPCRPSKLAAGIEANIDMHIARTQVCVYEKYIYKIYTSNKYSARCWLTYFYVSRL